MQRIGRSAVLAGILWCTLGTSTALGQVHRDFDYSYDQVWNTLVRLIRVDYRFPIEERDDAHGFVLFHYRDHGRRHEASLELVRPPVAAPAAPSRTGAASATGTTGTTGSSSAARSAHERVRLVVHIEGMPHRTETRVLDDIAAKLRADYGPPPPVVYDDEAAAGAANLRPRLSAAPSRIPTSDVPPGAADVTPPPAVAERGAAGATTSGSATTDTPTVASPAAVPNAGAVVDRRVYRTSDASPARGTGSVAGGGDGGDGGHEMGAPTRGIEPVPDGRVADEPTRDSRRTGRGRRPPPDGVRLSAGPPAEAPTDAPRILLR